MAPKRKKPVYNEEQLLTAVAAIKKGMSYRKASEKYGIPKSTLSDKIGEKTALSIERPGPTSFLTADQETRLVNWVVTMAKIGYGLPRKEIPLVVKDLLDQAEANGYEIPAERKFQDNLPSSTWIYAFLRRHPEVSARLPENLGTQRAAVTKETIKQWFENFENFLESEHQLNAKEFLVLENTHRVFNLDERGFPLQGTSGKTPIITEKGAKCVYRLAPESKEQITVLACVSASGSYAKPYVIFPGQRQPKYNFKGVNEDDFDVGFTPKGEISSDSFFCWIANLWYPSVRNEITFPVIVFMDGHTSYINISVAEFCRDHGIILYCLPAHSSHILQPLDVAVFGPMKKAWNAGIEDFKKKFCVTMTKAHFFQVFDKAWKESAVKENAVAGFASTGLLPFDMEKVDYRNLIDSNVVTKWKKQSNAQTCSLYEKLGITRCFSAVESILSEEQRQIFERNCDEGYDIVDNSAAGQLFQIYKVIKNMKDANPREQPAPTVADEPISLPE